jgi:hypothetical protein
MDAVTNIIVYSVMMMCMFVYTFFMAVFYVPFTWWAFLIGVVLSIAVGVGVGCVYNKGVKDANSKRD